ncbi:hypothetical protein ACMFMG_007249 [Clarireedia jacksonii]
MARRGAQSVVIEIISHFSSCLDYIPCFPSAKRKPSKSEDSEESPTSTSKTTDGGNIPRVIVKNRESTPISPPGTPADQVYDDATSETPINIKDSSTESTDVLTSEMSHPYRPLPEDSPRRHSHAFSQPSPQHHSADQPTGDINLRQQLVDCRVKISDPHHTYIVPVCEQDRLLSVAAVSDKILRSCADIDKEAAFSHATHVVANAKKLYATLLLVMKDADIRQILEEGISDVDLPLTYDIPSENRMASFYTCNGKPVKSFEDWGEEVKENFNRQQWSLMAPVFEGEKHRELNSMDLLPFLPLEDSENIQKRGAYGKVYPVRIHPSHHKFKLEGPRPLVAVKKLHSPDETEFRKEEDVLKTLGGGKPHQNLIHLLASFSQGGEYHLMFPWAQGNLRKYWEENAKPNFDESTVMWSLEQMTGITNALMRVHNFSPSFQQNVEGGVRLTETAKLTVKKGEEKFGRHGDIKPENILWFEHTSKNYPGVGVLKLADFGLGRFHGRESRSGLSPSGIKNSPTYEPPECQLHRPVSRSYDIWSLGCVFLEFITWLIRGNEQIEGFSEFRGTKNVHGIDDDNFFTILNPGSPTMDATVRKQVEDWVLQLHEHERCSKLIHELLDTIMGDLLVINSSSRITADKLNNLMQQYCRKAKGDKDYMLKSKPFPATSRSKHVTTHSSSPAPERSRDSQQTGDIQTPQITLNDEIPDIPKDLRIRNIGIQGRRNGTWPPSNRRD